MREDKKKAYKTVHRDCFYALFILFDRVYAIVTIEEDTVFKSGEHFVMRNQITQGMSLSNMENAIKEELQGKQLWGDINLSLSEYEALLERVKILLSFYENDVESFATQHPIATTTLW